MRNERRAVRRAIRMGWLALVLSCSACTRTESDMAANPSPAAQAAPLPAAATMHPDDIAGVTASYDCNGIRVDIVRDQVARVNLAPDNIVKIERLRGSVPATYQDVGLTLTTSPQGANLDDETGPGIACRPAPPPG